jgi:hypothetical protein
VSSSSSAEIGGAAAPVATLLKRAFEVLGSGCPRAHREMARRLGDSTVRLSVDDEVFDVHVERDAPRVRAPAGSPTVSVCTTRSAVRAVLAGRRRLADAVRADEVRAEGRLRDLVAVFEALEAFVHGAVRCDKIAQLYDDFQHEGAA